jgi:hypothetical protein
LRNGTVNQAFSLLARQTHAATRPKSLISGQFKEMPTPSGASHLRAIGVSEIGLIVGTGSFGGVEKGFVAKYHQ